MTGGPDPIHPLVGLIRRFSLDWLGCADPRVCEEIMAPGYTATVGGVALRGRDEAYLPATLGQLHRFPGLLLTVHDLFVSPEWAALRFTEHGASPDRGGAAAAWGGIGIFAWDGRRLTANVTEEDYLARRRQLAEGRPDPVATPATAPWSCRPAAPDAGAEAAVRRWLRSGDLGAGGRVELDDGWTGRPTPNLVDQQDVEIDTLFSAGRKVAVHFTQRGLYQGGIDLPDQPIGAAVGLRGCALVEVDPGAGAQAEVARGHVIRDRVGLRRDLTHLAAEG